MNKTVSQDSSKDLWKKFKDYGCKIKIKKIQSQLENSKKKTFAKYFDCPQAKHADFNHDKERLNLEWQKKV